jgi:putative ABC transport system permease protein
MHLRHAFRQLGRTPGFTAIAGITLALGIGATTTMFSVVNATFLRPLPYAHPEQLVHLNERGATSDWLSISYPDFRDWAAQQDTLSNLALYRLDGRNLKTDELVERVAIGYVSGDFFPTLGIRMQAGRPLTPTDDQPGAAPLVWMSDAAWQRYFHRDAHVLGQSVSIGGQSLTVAGILSGDFHFVRPVDFLAALAPNAASMFMDQRQNHNDAYGIGRLKPGVSLEQARLQLEAIGQRIEQQFRDSNTGVRPTVVPLRQRLVGDSRSQVLLLLGAVAILLLITCVNVANMLLARSMARTREIAVRTAIGASRWQIARQFLTESLLLGLGGGLLGCLLGLWGYDFAQRLVPWELRSLTGTAGGFDWRVAGFVLLASVIVGVASGLAPAWRLARTDPNDALKTQGSSARLGRWRLPDLLVTAQVALALMLLIAAGLMIRSLQRVLQINPGFRASQVMTLEPAGPSMEEFGRDPMAVGRYYDEIVANVQRLPGVQSAAFCSSLPFTNSQSWMNFFRTDRPVPDGGGFPSASNHTVTPDYFRVMSVPLLRGRTFTGREPVPQLRPGVALTPAAIAAAFKGIMVEVVISQRMADRVWPGEDPVGKRFQMGYPSMGLPQAEVIGVVGNTTQFGLDQGEAPEFYMSSGQMPTPIGMHLVVRSTMDEAALVPLLRGAVQAVTKDKPILDVKPMSARIGASTEGRRFNMALFTFFAGAAVFLAMLGIYGVLGFVVTQRTRELGIRLALGAQRAHVLRTVLWRGFALVLIGTTVGMAGGWACSRMLQSQLFGISSNDPVTYLLGAALLLTVALAACLVPARRATQVDPLIALKAE